MYQLNEGLLAVPESWRDESVNVFIHPEYQTVNLVVSRSVLPQGINLPEHYQQTMALFKGNLPGYEELERKEVLLAGGLAWQLEYRWKSSEGKMHQIVIMQARPPLMMTFTISAVESGLSAEAKEAVLEVIHSFEPAGDSTAAK